MGSSLRSLYSDTEDICFCGCKIMEISQMWLIFICVIVGLLLLVALAFIFKTFLCKGRKSKSKLRKSSSFFEAVQKKSDQSPNKSQEELANQVDQLGKSHQRLEKRLDNIEKQLSDDTCTFSSETSIYDEKYRKMSELTIDIKQVISDEDKANLTTISKALDSTFWKDDAPSISDSGPIYAEVLNSTKNKASEEKIDIDLESDDNIEAVETLDEHLEKLENSIDKKRRAGLKTL